VPRNGSGEPPGISLTHARGMVACAIAPGGAVGVDVEPIDASLDTLRIARELFAPDEVVRLERCAASDRPARFCELWTLREAFFKAAGLGLGLPRESASFAIDGGAVTVTPALAILEGAWTCTVDDVAGAYKLAVVVSGPRETGRVTLREVDASLL
jgi:4'-phosphopantetheinyl transferase